MGMLENLWMDGPNNCLVLFGLPQGVPHGWADPPPPVHHHHQRMALMELTPHPPKIQNWNSKKVSRFMMISRTNVLDEQILAFLFRTNHHRRRRRQFLPRPPWKKVEKKNWMVK